MDALQFTLNMEPNPLLSIIDNLKSNDINNNNNNSKYLNELIMKFKLLNIDPSEFAYLKAIVLFKPGKYYEFSEV